MWRNTHHHTKQKMLISKRKSKKKTPYNILKPKENTSLILGFPTLTNLLRKVISKVIPKKKLSRISYSKNWKKNTHRATHQQKRYAKKSKKRSVNVVCVCRSGNTSDRQTTSKHTTKIAQEIFVLQDTFYFHRPKRKHLLWGLNQRVKSNSFLIPKNPRYKDQINLDPNLAIA